MCINSVSQHVLLDTFLSGGASVEQVTGRAVAFVINVFADGVVSDSDDAALSAVPPVSKGQKMEGQFFPLLFEGVNKATTN